MKTVFLTIIWAALCFGCGHSNSEQASKPLLEKQRGLARAVILEECTNEVIGIHSIVSLDLDTSGDAITNWTAVAVLDYVNRQGGTDRTNLPYRFHTVGSRLFGILDYDIITKRQWQESKARLDAIK